MATEKPNGLGLQPFCNMYYETILSLCNEVVKEIDPDFVFEVTDKEAFIKLAIDTMWDNDYLE